MSRIVADRRRWSATGYQLDKLEVPISERTPSSTSRLPREAEIERTPAETVHIADGKIPAKRDIQRTRAEADLLAGRF